ncbi:MAG: ATPase [Kosmotoga sp.]|nr:MAG: ATPase [Kosmotoga sp.]
MRTIILDGNISYKAVSQILNSKVLKELIEEIIDDCTKRNCELMPFLEKFKNKGKSYDVYSIMHLMQSLFMNKLEYVDTSSYYNFPDVKGYKESIALFVEKLYNAWRTKHRFMIKYEKYIEGESKYYKQMMLAESNSELKNLVLYTYRQILRNVSDERLKILRQLPGGAQAGFLVDTLKLFDRYTIEKCPQLKKMKFIWSAVFQPPVVFHTRSNKRSGLFKVVDKPIMKNLKLRKPKDWYVLPLFVGKKLIYVVTYKDYLAHAAGLCNLFELGDLERLKKMKAQAIYFFGIENELFNNEQEANGIIYREEDGTYIGLLGRKEHTDYFGYMKKMILTLHNLIVIDEGNLPVHGALAKIKLKNEKQFNIMIMGDSGAGKSETIDALNRLGENVSDVEIVIDDMGSLEIIKDHVVAFGTETGAFVRLDDLQPGYAYSAMDRSIFMNPEEHNARVIVPYSNYEEIIKPTKVDLFLYANNYEKKGKDQKALTSFDSEEEAYNVLSSGIRKAKGTTSEEGLTRSYFANPFGAVQRKQRHEKIARYFIGKMFENNIFVGELKTQLGIDGYEEKGPLQAAKDLLDYLLDNG